MSKQTKERHSCRKEVQEEIYKEFIRQKVLKYQHQFPRMTQFEIYQKIGREWQAFNQKQKQQLYTLYVSNHFISSQPKNEQFESTKQIQDEKEGSSNVIQNQVYKTEAKEEKNQQRRTTRGMSKQSNHNENIIQQMIVQKPPEIKSKPIPYLQLGQTLSRKLKQLDRNNKQSVNIYKAVFEQVQKQHKKAVNVFNKTCVSLEFSMNLEETAKKLKEINKSLDNIKEQPVEQDSSQLSPEQQLILKQPNANKSSIDLHKQNQRLRVAIKLKIDESLKKDSKFTKNIQKISQRSPYLSVKLQEKPTLPKKTSEYLEFYKEGYQKLKQSCSFLTGFEITKIITNLWHKQKAAKKLGLRNAKFSSVSTPPEKKIELSSLLAHKIGKINFIKSKLKEQYLAQEAHQLWKNLPLQSKIKWIYPDSKHYQQMVKKQQSPAHGIVRYRSNQTSDTHLYDLGWDIFEDAVQKQQHRCDKDQRKQENQ